MDDDRFPLTFMTEGQGQAGTVDVPTVQWTWNTMGRMKFTDFITHCDIPADKKLVLVVLRLKFIPVLIGLLNNMV